MSKVSRLTSFMALGLFIALAPMGGAMADDAAAASKPGADCNPYQTYACLDTYLNQDGDDVYDRIVNYYQLEWGQPGPPASPNAHPSRRDCWPDIPQTSAR